MFAPMLENTRQGDRVISARIFVSLAIAPKKPAPSEMAMLRHVENG
jgi:hypothetical protein